MHSCQMTIVADTKMRKRSPFRETCRSTGVLYVDGIIAVTRILSLLISTFTYGKTHCHQFVDGEHATVLLGTHVYHRLHGGECRTVKMPFLLRLQFRQHLIGHLHEIIVFFMLYDTKYLHVALAYHILNFVLLEIGVDHNGDSANLGTCKEHGVPIGDVTCPNTYMSTFLHTYSQQAHSKAIHTIVELLEGPPHITV